MIKELSSISMKNPLEITRENEIFMSQSLGTKDYSPFFMKIYEYFNQMALGMPFSTEI